MLQNKNRQEGRKADSKQRKGRRDQIVTVKWKYVRKRARCRRKHKGEQRLNKWRRRGGEMGVGFGGSWFDYRIMRSLTPY